MNDIFAPVKLLLRPSSRDVYNFTFDLHTKYTVVVLVACSLLLTAQYAKEPISCLTTHKFNSDKILDLFCWVNGTFTFPDRMNDRVGLEVISPGVGVEYTRHQQAHKRYQHYYQWMAIVLLLQASFFYLPRYIWKMWEGNVLASLLPHSKDQLQLQFVDLEAGAGSHDTATKGDSGGGGGGGGDDRTNSNGRNKDDSSQVKINHHVASLVKFFQTNAYRRRAYVAKFTICELLNVCNVFGQLVAVDHFLDNSFAYYGLDVLRYLSDADAEADATAVNASPMDELFPKLAKCTFYKYGPSGTIETVDALCVLGWNIVFEKIYFVMWWWFVVLVVFTIINFVNRLLVFGSRKLRFYLLRDVATLSNASTVKWFADKADFSDLFLLCKIAKNVNYRLFDKLLLELKSCRTSFEPYVRKDAIVCFHIMNFKSALVQQSLALMSVFVNMLMYGSTTSWMSNAVIFFTSPGHVPSATVEECGFMAQLFEAGRLIFAIPGGILVDKFGRKKILVGVGGLNFILWVMLCFSQSLLAIYTARLLQGMAVALLYVSAFSMIGEIASPQYRGTLSSINELANMTGQLFESVVTIATNSYIALTACTAVLASMFFPTICWVIESPHYLVNVYDYGRAKQNLKIVRPGYSDSDVDNEFDQLIESISVQKRQRTRTTWLNIYRVKVFRRSLQCALLLNWLAVSCGGPVMVLYASVMLPTNRYFSNEFYPFISFLTQFVAALGSTCVLDAYPRRRLFMAAALLSLAMQTLNAITCTVYIAYRSEWSKWFFIANNFSYMLVDRGLISPLNCTVRSEIFPHALKGIGNALCVICQAVSLIVSYRIYNYVFDAYGLPANFAVFAFDSALLAAVIYLILPEMSGKSLAELQTAIETDPRERTPLLAKKIVLR